MSFAEIFMKSDKRLSKQKVLPRLNPLNAVLKFVADNNLNLILLFFIENDISCESSVSSLTK